MAKRIIGKQRLTTIKNLNKQATRKINRLKTKYDVDVDVVVKDPSTFSSIKEYNAYVKKMQHFTDRKNYRYIELEIKPWKHTNQKEVVEYSVYQDWARVQRSGNKKKRKALKERLEYINAGQKKQYTLEEIEKNPLLAKQLNVSSLIPTKVNTKAFRQRFESPDSIQRNTQRQKERNFNPLYFNDRDAKAKDNFINAMMETFSDIVDSDKLNTFIKKVEGLSLNEWQKVLYTFREDPFQYLYQRGASVHRYNLTVKKFNFNKELESEMLEE